jgi:deazaflavin-dependent oxidoreductase (nitroreductase family)
MTDLDNPVDAPGGWQREHLERYVASGGTDGHLWRDGVPTLLLTTVGRRTGTARRTPLIYGRHGDRYLVVASKGGADEPPAWYGNLLAHPRVRVQVGPDVFDADAQVATAAEKPELWRVMAEIWPDYDAYQAKTAREIPVVVLTPVRG